MALTRAVSALPRDQLYQLMRAVQAFPAFDDGNDPYGEHDFGAVKLNGETYLWKIDAYADDLVHGSPDRADPDVTLRVLTLMRADEY